MRLSTAQIHNQGLQGMLQKQQAMAKTQQQMTTGSKLVTAADDPAAFSNAQRLDHAVSSLEQFDKSSGHLERRLGLQENALADAGDQLVRARELVIRANTPTLSGQDRRLIAIEMRQLRAEMIAIGNRGDGAGRALFAGTRDGVVPFADNGGTVTYAGDAGRNDVDVAPDLAVADTDPGSALFLRVPTGDGIVRGSAGASNTGTVLLASASVTDHASWNGAGVTVEFTGSDQYRVLDAGGAEIGSGQWQSGQTITAGGVQMELRGEPVAGDRFTVERASERDIFATLDGLADALEAPDGSPADNARRTNLLTAGLGDLATAQEHLLAARADTGARLSTLDHAAESRSATALALESTLSDLRDTDYAEAASRFAMQLTALQAAQQVTVRIQGLSLFNRL